MKVSHFFEVPHQVTHGKAFPTQQRFTDRVFFSARWERFYSSLEVEVPATIQDKTP